MSPGVRFAPAKLPAALVMLARTLRYGRAVPPHHDAGVRQLFLKQQRVRRHRRIGHEQLLHTAAVRRVRRGKQAHADVVRHVAAHLLPVRAAAASGREVQRFNISPAPVGPDIAQAAQIAHRGDWVDRKGEKAAVG